MSKDKPESEARNRTCKNSGVANCYLLPCPFCGKQPGQRTEEALQSRTGRWHIFECDNPNCLEVVTYAANLDEAIKSWNKRHTANNDDSHKETWIAAVHSTDRIFKETVKKKA